MSHCNVGICSSPVHCKEIGHCFSVRKQADTGCKVGVCSTPFTCIDAQTCRLSPNRNMSDRQLLQSCVDAMKVAMSSPHRTDWGSMITAIEKHLSNT